MTYSVGSLVKARGREWVVMPESEADFLVLKPLGGDGEIAGVHPELEIVESAHFGLPDPGAVGDFVTCDMLRKAAQLSARAYAGPLRSLGRIAVDPRPYQLVPLLMALKLDPVRLLIADDVGVGKTIEACLVARELLDRGEIARTAVLCPPHLAEQWQSELASKFHIDAELVLASTASRLERDCAVGESLFHVYPHVVVSMDFIKSDRRREEFLRSAPEFVIVDEAHTCAFGYERGSGRHQRHELVSGLSADPKRHLILVTATPHSGKEDAFRSLIKLLDAGFADLPDDLAGPDNERRRRRLATHLVQRRRADIVSYMKALTCFPRRDSQEDHYTLHGDYRRLFDKAVDYVRESVEDESGTIHQQRVRWWSALALLRALASSPMAAAATLKTRARVTDTDSAETADEIGRQTVLDISPEEQLFEAIDVVAGSQVSDPNEDSARRRLTRMAAEAQALAGAKDAKLIRMVDHVRTFVEDGYNPILFCRFIQTAEYVRDELRRRLPSYIAVASVTGLLPPAEREAQVADLARNPKRVLVATDCLSEGINLQDHFNAVIHYDLSWNPTRHEQREGRVDRFGQASPTVRVMTYYGIDNQIDGIVLRVLLRKHKEIRSSLGISVPVPVDAAAVEEAVIEGLRLRRRRDLFQLTLPGIREHAESALASMNTVWDRAVEEERRSRTMFAQAAIKPDEVAEVIAEMNASVPSSNDVEEFVVTTLKANGGIADPHSKSAGVYSFNLGGVPRAVREYVGADERFRGKFDMPVPEGTVYLSRTSPIVEALASYTLDTALDPLGEGKARRCGVMITGDVGTRTTLLLVRFRYDIMTRKGEAESSQLAEECVLLAFQGSPQNAVWLGEGQAEALLQAVPSQNVPREMAVSFASEAVHGYSWIEPHLRSAAANRADLLLAAHRRVRSAARIKGVSYSVSPKLPADILGMYVYLPERQRREH